jgi:nitrous oxide reductase accessory protein NosL
MNYCSDLNKIANWKKPVMATLIDSEMARIVTIDQS